MMNMMEELEQNKRKVHLQIAVAVTVVLPTLALVLFAGLADLQTWMRGVLLGIGMFMLIGGIAIAAALDVRTGTFECRHCKTRFVPTVGAYLAGPHTLLYRRLKCPNCGKKSFCRHRLTH